MQRISNLFLLILVTALLVIGCTAEDEEASPGGGTPDPCDNVTCGANAHCDADTGDCVCNEGYTGDPDTECVTDRCIGVVCGTNASCDNNTGGCVCDEGYEGDPDSGCIPGLCLGVTCGDNAHCLGGDCVCDDGYTGDPDTACVVDVCYEVTCGAGAHCDEGDCVCDDGLVGDPDVECVLICDHRSVANPLGYPCNLDEECADNMCLWYNDGWTSLCSRSCPEGGDECPAEFDCVDGGDLGWICVPTAGADGTLPRDESIALYSVCNVDEDCADETCLMLGGAVKFCAKSCTSVLDDSCGICGKCVNGGDELGYICVPLGTGDVGDECAYQFDCESYMCLDSEYCSDNCSIYARAENDSCPDGYTCIHFDADEPYNLCYDDAVLNKGFGEACDGDFQCVSGICTTIGEESYCNEECSFDQRAANDSCPEGFDCIDLDGVSLCYDETLVNKAFGDACEEDFQCETGLCSEILGNKTCTATCFDDVCGEGTCIDMGPLSMDTKLWLWDDTAEEFILYNDDGGEGLFSKIESDLDAGAYYAEVSGYSASTTGYYYLTVTDGSGDPTGSDEAEDNNDKASANAVTIPAKVLGFIDLDDHDFFSFTLADTASLTLETSVVNLMICVPDSLIGNVAYGDECQESFQCENDGLCFNSYCTMECTVAGDECPEDGSICHTYEIDDEEKSYCVPGALVGALATGDDCGYDYECVGEECFNDTFLGETYCSEACTEGGDTCPDGFGCNQSHCVRAMDGRQYVYEVCRVNGDCETAVCVDGECTTECTGGSTDCEGNGPISPVEYDVCWTCTLDSDCNADSSTYNMCLSTATESFCGVDCSADPTICPAETRCYPILVYFWYEYQCAPVAFSCNGGTVCATNGYCTLPRGQLYDACDEETDCVSGFCENDICNVECTSNEDCGCDYYTCDGSYCEFTDDGDTVEVEPNDAIDAPPQELATFPATVVGELLPVDGIDIDLYKVHLDAAQVLGAETLSFCATQADTHLRFLDDQGEVIEGFVNDDKDGYSGDYFSILTGFQAESAMDVYIEVKQSPYLSSPTAAKYLLKVTVFTPADNDTCDGAVALTTGSYNYDMASALNRYDGSACTGGSETSGVDLVFSVDVDEGDYLEVTVDAAFNAALYLVTDCDDIDNTCLAGSDAGDPEHAIWLNAVANRLPAPTTVMVIVDSRGLIGNDSDFDITVTTGAIVAPSNDTGDAAEALDLSSGSDTVSGSSIGAADDYNPSAVTDGPCAELDEPGNDVVYSLEIAADKILTVELDGFPADMYLVTDYADLSTCAAYGARGKLRHVNLAVAERADSAYYLIVDSPDAEEFGNFELTATVEDIPAGNTCADPVLVETLPASISNSNENYTDYFSNQSDEFSSCWGWDAMGRDVIYLVEVPAGHTLTAAVDPAAGVDLGLYLLDDCVVPYEQSNCLASADDGLDGEVDELSWDNAGVAAVDVYLVVDTWVDYENGDFSLDISSAATAVE